MEAAPRQGADELANSSMSYSVVEARMCLVAGRSISGQPVRRPKTLKNKKKIEE